MAGFLGVGPAGVPPGALGTRSRTRASAERLRRYRVWIRTVAGRPRRRTIWIPVSKSRVFRKSRVQQTRENTHWGNLGGGGYQNRTPLGTTLDIRIKVRRPRVQLRVSISKWSVPDADFGHSHPDPASARVVGQTPPLPRGWLAGWLASRLPGWLTGWLHGWLPGWLAGWVAGWLAGWLAGCLLFTGRTWYQTLG